MRLLVKNERFNLVIKVKNFIKNIDYISINFPRKDYIIRDNLIKSSYGLLELIYRANYSNDKDMFKFDILTNISMIDFYLEISCDRGIINIKRLTSITKSLEEITKMVYGWMNECKIK